MLPTSTVSEEIFKKTSAQPQMIYRIINLSQQLPFRNVKLYI